LMGVEWEWNLNKCCLEEVPINFGLWMDYNKNFVCNEDRNIISNVFECLILLQLFFYYYYYLLLILCFFLFLLCIFF
jgi:hypothetical protein